MSIPKIKDKVLILLEIEKISRRGIITFKLYNSKGKLRRVEKGAWLFI